MKQPPRQDFSRADATNPGDAAPPEDDPADAEDPDEFPSESTRIDPNFLSAAAPPVRPRAQTGGTPTLASRGNLPTRPKQVSGQLDKLAALQSLSLHSDPATGSTRLPPAPRAPGGSKLPWVLLILVLGGLAAQRYWPGHTPSLEGPNKPVVKTEVVSFSSDGTQPYLAAGYTAARLPISIGASVGGRVKAVKIQPGEKVKHGQTIVWLDDSAPQAALNGVRVGIRVAEANLETQKKFFKIQAVTGVEVEKARGLLDIEKSKQGPFLQQIAQTRIQAPIDGTIIEVVTHPGEVIAPNSTVAKIADTTQLTAEVDVAEADLKKIRLQQAVDITSGAVGERVYKGNVAAIAETIDKAKGTAIVRVDFEVQDESVKSGMSVRCAFQPPKGEKPRMYVPRTAVNAQGGVLLVAANGKVSNHPVTTLAAQGALVEVTGGLAAGDRIVSDASMAHEGMTITLTPEGATP